MLCLGTIQTGKMLHVLNLLLVVLLPALTSSFPHNNRWKEMYDRLQAGYPAPPSSLDESYVCCNNPATPPTFLRPRPPWGTRRRPLKSLTMGGRSAPLHRALEELTRLQHQQNAAEDVELLPPHEVSGLLAPRGAPTHLAAPYSRSRQEEALARLLGARVGTLSAASGSQPLPLVLHDPSKRGGFVAPEQGKRGSPASAGGVNMFGQ